jgi:SagB-type dehydrogenase family enzyme
MKANFLELEEFETDQEKGVTQPPLVKAVDGERILLPSWESLDERQLSLKTLFYNRASRRKFSLEPLTQEELSWLLFSTQGIKKKVNDKATYRPVPSGGARHSFETYLVLFHVEGLVPGLYYYDPVEHGLVLIEKGEFGQAAIEGTLDQDFAGNAAVTFVWACIPYRSEWRYHISAHKTMLLDAGHICQNLYLAAESIGCGTCAIAAYDQEKMDQLIHVDGEDEFVVYVAPVGRRPEKN